ncbi:MAG: hypothetical protein ABII72_01005 [Parcubacteria group bacterium]
MKQKMRTIVPMMLAIAVAVTLTAGGCAKTEETTTDTTSEETVEEVDENWTTATGKGDIADEAISGTINGEEVTIESVSIKDWDGEYSWSFSTLAPDSTCGVVIDDNAVNFSSKALQAGTFAKKMEDEIEFSDYHAYYHYEQEDGTPMSVNVDWDATIVVKEVDKDANKVSGWAKFDFSDEKTALEGSFEADLCE